jgi:hypothetical protein
MNFEDLYKITGELEQSPTNNERAVSWCGAKEILGFAKRPSGAIEIFLKGDELQAELPLVQRCLSHDEWLSTDGTRFTATCITFPAESHYRAVAAFVAEELFRNGLLDSASLPTAFANSERVLEIQLRRSALPENQIIGLVGELCLMRLMLSHCLDDAEKDKVVSSWRGYEMHSPDFCFGLDSVIEVKTTTSNHSVHKVSSISQVDPQVGRLLYLASFGLELMKTGEGEIGSLTLPVLVEEILSLLGPNICLGRREPRQERILEKIKEYGVLSGTSASGYDHNVMATWPAYSLPFKRRFARFYNMADSRIKVLRREHLAPCTSVNGESVKFEINLAAEVDGDINPEKDERVFSRKFLGR